MTFATLLSLREARQHKRARGWLAWTSRQVVITEFPRHVKHINATDTSVEKMTEQPVPISVDAANQHTGLSKPRSVLAEVQLCAAAWSGNGPG